MKTLALVSINLPTIYAFGDQTEISVQKIYLELSALIMGACHPVQIKIMAVFTTQTEEE